MTAMLTRISQHTGSCSHILTLTITVGFDWGALVDHDRVIILHYALFLSHSGRIVIVMHAVIQ